jgi:predicted methyltransferase
LKDEVVQLVIFDPQYEDVKKVTVGGGISDSKIRKVFFHPSPIKEQTEMDIKEFCKEIFRVLKPNGWMMLWMNENILIKGRYKE